MKFNHVVLLSGILITLGLFAVLYKHIDNPLNTLTNRQGGDTSEREAPYVSDIGLRQSRTQNVWYTIVVHKASGLDVHAYDSSGRHTGPAPNPDPQSEFGFLENRIPSSSISRFGGDWYLTLRSNDMFLIKLQGKASEYSALEIILGLSGDDSAARLTYDIGKVSPSFNGTIRLTPDMATPPELLVNPTRRLTPTIR